MGSRSSWFQTPGCGLRRKTGSRRLSSRGSSMRRTIGLPDRRAGTISSSPRISPGFAVPGKGRPGSFADGTDFQRRGDQRCPGRPRPSAPSPRSRKNNERAGAVQQEGPLPLPPATRRNDSQQKADLKKTGTDPPKMGNYGTLLTSVSIKGNGTNLLLIHICGEDAWNIFQPVFYSPVGEG